MAEEAWYKEWFSSPYYHKLYFERDEKEAGAFIKKLLEYLHPRQGARILDVACGRGRHSRILASMGYHVTGIDLSMSSIQWARQFENENLDFYVHDMRLPFWGNYFDFAFNFFTSFGYFRTRREHDDAMRTIARSLKKEGIFVIDYLNVHYAEEHMRHQEVLQIGSANYEIHRWDDETHFCKKITVHDPVQHQNIEHIEKVAKFSLGDFTEMLAFQGLQVQEVFGDYNFSRYDIRKTPRLIIVAAKLPLAAEDKEKRVYSDGRATDALT
jgi:SAM-dependent methyltransferase